MIRLEIFASSAVIEPLAKWLDALEGVSRLTVRSAVRSGQSLLSAALAPSAVDVVEAELGRLGVADRDVTLSREEIVGRRATEAGSELVWTDVLGQAWVNARPVGRYLAFMFGAGVIACYGVVDRNAILIVGAMAVSPDLLPITAIAVGTLSRRFGLAGRAFLTLALGMAATIVAAALLAFAQNQLDLLPSGFSIEASATALGGLTTVNDETIVVALAAGAAGMLALETRVAAAVGVAISVTTIPAAAYLGVAAGLGELDKALGALGVLGMNVVMMVLGATLTLALQSRVAPRSATRAIPAHHPSE